MSSKLSVEKMMTSNAEFKNSPILLERFHNTIVKFQLSLKKSKDSMEFSKRKTQRSEVSVKDLYKQNR